MRRFLLCGVLMILLAGCGTAGEQTPEEVPEEVLEGETEALSGEGLVSSAMEAYAAITKDLTFTLDVTAEDAEPLTLSITPESAWNVAGWRTCSPTATSGSRPRPAPLACSGPIWRTEDCASP